MNTHHKCEKHSLWGLIIFLSPRTHDRYNFPPIEFSFDFLTHTITKTISVWKSSSQGNHTTNGNHVHGSRRHAPQRRHNIHQPRQSSLCQWNIRWCRWKLSFPLKRFHVFYVLLLQTLTSTLLFAGVFLTLLIRSMQRVKRLEKFEKMIWFFFFIFIFCFIPSFFLFHFLFLQ